MIVKYFLFKEIEIERFQPIVVFFYLWKPWQDIEPTIKNQFLTKKDVFLGQNVSTLT